MGGWSYAHADQVDRLKDDKVYLKQLSEHFAGAKDKTGVAVTTSARDTLSFLDGRRRFWDQAKA